MMLTVIQHKIVMMYDSGQTGMGDKMHVTVQSDFVLEPCQMMMKILLLTW